MSHTLAGFVVGVLVCDGFCSWRDGNWYLVGMRALCVAIVLRLA